MPKGLLPVRVERFIHAVNAAQGLDDVFQALLKRMQEMDFERIAYFVSWPKECPGRPLCLSNHPEGWGEHYEKENMVEDDYVVRHAVKTVVPFMWHQILRHTRMTKKQRIVFGDAAAAGMRAGGTVPLHGPAKGTFTVSNDMTEAEFERLFLERRHEVQITATYAHEKILNMGLNKSVAGMLSLTPRETEILTWMAKGKSRWETGIILSVKEDTVRAHLESARAKLDATNTANAIAIAIANNLVIP